MLRFVISDYSEGLPGDFPGQPFHSQSPSLEKIRAKQAALNAELSQHFDQSEKFLPFFLEKMQGYIVQFEVVGGLAIGFLSLPGKVIVGFSQDFSFRIGQIFGHSFLHNGNVLVQVFAQGLEEFLIIGSAHQPLQNCFRGGSGVHSGAMRGGGDHGIIHAPHQPDPLGDVWT